MIVALDIGNSFIKWGEFRDGRLNAVSKVEHESLLDRLEDIHKSTSRLDLILCQTGHLAEEIKSKLAQRHRLLQISNKLKLPFDSNYKSPFSLGADRIALVAGATETAHEGDTLIIDFGTCITYDLLINNEVYAGGAISAGLFMRYQAMHNLTASLPLLEPVETTRLTGQTTEECMHSGVVNGLWAEIEGMVSRYTDSYKNLRVITTGGGSSVLPDRLKNRFFAAPNLLLHGMHKIYNLNRHNE